MDEAVVNGANLFYAPQFGIDPNATDGNAGRNQWLLGLVNSAPYVRSFCPDSALYRQVSRSCAALLSAAGFRSR
jgi:hypothetical protein